MYLMDIDSMEYNEEYYLHCVKILENTIIKETGAPPETLQDLWDNYIFYPMEKSKAYAELQEYEVYHPAPKKKKRKKRKK
jgi:hypothetical protein